MVQLRRRSNPNVFGSPVHFLQQTWQSTAGSVGGTYAALTPVAGPSPSASASATNSNPNASSLSPSLRHRMRNLPPRAYFVLTVIAIQCAWMTVDRIGHTLCWDRFEAPMIHIVPDETSPMTPAHFYSREYQGPSRAFPIYEGDFCSNVLIPQEEMYQRTNPDHGLLYVKEMKTASTTLSGITARISRNTAKQRIAELDHPPAYILKNRTATWTCMARFVHIRARRFRVRRRDQSFLWSFVREPTSRLISKFLHFGVAREGKSKDAAAFRKYLASNEVNDFAYYLKTLTLRPKINPYRHDQYANFVDEILQSYDFIGVSDRMEESLAVLQILLDLQTQDLLYLSTKTNGSYDFYPRTQECTLIPKADESVQTLAFKQYLYGEEFEDFVSGDVAVYRAVNQSLDRTIDALGRDRVQRVMQRLRVAQEIANRECLAITKFPCSKDGQHQPVNDCLQQDVACGYQCLDKVGEQLLEKSKEFTSLPP